MRCVIGLSLRGTILAAILAAILTVGLGLGQGAMAANDCVRPAGGKAHPAKVVPFEINSAEINAASKAGLKEIAARFDGNKSLDICIIGRADRSGDQGYNQELAMKRATAVADFLKSAGLKSKYQVISAGQPYGDDSWLGKLIGSGEKQGDRRVEVIVMER